MDLSNDGPHSLTSDLNNGSNLSERLSRNSSQSGGSSSTSSTSVEKLKMLDITRDKPIKVSVRVSVPVKDHPKVI